MALIVVASTTAAARTPAPARTSTTSAGTSATTARSAGAALGLGARLVDVQCASAKFFPVQSRDGFLSLRRVGYLDKGKSARAAGVTIGDEADLIDFAVGFKQGSQLCFRGAVGEIAYKKLLHGFPFPVSQRKPSGLVGEFG
jgi:hypothetical protein